MAERPDPVEYADTDSIARVFDRITDAVFALDETFEITYLNDQAEDFLEVEFGEVRGKRLWDVYPDTKGTAVYEAFNEALETQESAESELYYEPLDRWVDARIYPSETGITVYLHDVTELKEYERRLEHQREQLVALNNLYGVVREVTDAAIQQSTREEIEQTVCECLAATGSYRFAWIGEVEASTDTIAVRAEAGVDDSLGGDERTIPLDSDQNYPGEVLADAIQTRELRLIQNIEGGPRGPPWYDRVVESGIRSLVAIPIIHDDSLYGLLAVYADRPQAFTDEERAVIGQLGEIVGHAITAVERKRALTADELVELEFHIREFFGAIDTSVGTDGRIAFTQAVPVENETYVVYGETTDDGVETLEQLTAQHPDWNTLRVRARNTDVVKFEVSVSKPPVIATVVARDGTVDQAVIENGEYTLTTHFPTGTDIRAMIETIQETYPTAEVVAHRQVARADSVQQLTQTWMAALTDRQQTVLQAAYYAGFFEWPRESSGEEIADALDIAPSTFSQHIRKAERKLFSVLFDEDY